MQTIRLEGDPPIDILLKRSRRARRLSLRISNLDGRVSLTVPRGVRERTVLSFAREKEGWLRRHLDRQEAPVTVAPGMALPIEGVAVPLLSGEGRRVELTEAGLVLPGPADRAGVKAMAWLKVLARDRLSDASDVYAAKLGRGFGRLTLRDTRSRWGSCSSEGNLMFSWRLVMAPPDVLRYVAAHEVAHLAEMNHGPAFWLLVGKIFPNYQAPKDWLRRNGAALHRYRFTD